MKLPSEIRNVIESARKVARAHVELKRAAADEASKRVLEQKARARNAALEELTKHAIAFEKMLERAKAAPAKGGSGFDWNGLFRAAGAAIELVASAKRGDPATVQKAKDFIDAEIIND